MTTFDRSTHMSDRSHAMSAVIHFHGVNYCANISNCMARSVSNVNTVIRCSHNRPADVAMRFVFTMHQIKRHPSISCEMGFQQINNRIIAEPISHTNRDVAFKSVVICGISGSPIWFAI